MSSRRRGLLEAVTLTGTAIATGWVATTAWRGFTDAPHLFLYPLLGLGLMVLVIGTGLRHLRVPVLLVLLAQLFLGGLAATSLVAGAPVVTGQGWLRFGQEISSALDTAQRYQAPVPVDAPGVDPLLVLGGWFCLVLLDLLVGGLRRVPLAGLPLLTIYSIPVSMLGGGVPWWSFTLTAGGFLLLLFLQHREQTSRWGRGIGEAGRQPGTAVAVTSGAVRTSAASLGAGALLLAVLVPQFVPTMSLDVLGFGPGDGSGGDIVVDNPMTDLRRDLLRGEDEPLLRIVTDNPDPGYLRIAALNRFTDNEWSTGDRDIPEGQRAQGPLPLDDVDPQVPRERYPTDVSVMMNFDSRWLPAAYPLERIFAVGDWRYDTSTLDFIAADDDLNAAGSSYQMTEVVLDYDGVDLAEAPSWAGKVSRDYIALPDDFPSVVRSLAQEVTRDHPTRYEKAVALQDWFRVGGGFKYSLDNVDTGNGTDELVTFLTEGEGGRVGYCEQFSASMAVMARSLGIPARVAVGFLEPDQLGPRTWEYSSYDLHAWPELYFSGAGWVRFEPTPGDRAEAVPSYTLDRIPTDEPTDDPNQGQSPDDPNQSLGPDRQPDPGALPEGDTGSTGDDGLALVPVLLGGGGALLVVLLALTPRLARGAAARRRLQGGIEPAWAEIRATSIDLGLPWPEHRSPRETRSHLLPWLGSTDPAETRQRPVRGPDAAPEAAAALDRVVDRQEQERYARPGGVTGTAHHDPAVVHDTEAVVAALRGGASDRAVRRATWWPTSVLPWRAGATPTAASPELVRHGGVVDHVG